MSLYDDPVSPRQAFEGSIHAYRPFDALARDMGLALAQRFGAHLPEGMLEFLAETLSEKAQDDQNIDWEHVQTWTGTSGHECPLLKAMRNAYRDALVKEAA